jgi:hypothetical protein
VGPRAGLDGCGNSCLTGIRSPDIANTKVSVFFFIICTHINFVSNNIKKIINLYFLISFQLKFTPVPDD